MKKTILLTLMAAASWSASAYAAHTADVPSADTLQVTTTPQMHCENCEKKIKSNIRFVKGVKKIETSVPEQKVTIIYNPKKSTYQDFVKAFKKIGYDISVAPGKKISNTISITAHGVAGEKPFHLSPATPLFFRYEKHEYHTLRRPLHHTA